MPDDLDERGSRRKEMFDVAHEFAVKHLIPAAFPPIASKLECIENVLLAGRETNRATLRVLESLDRDIAKLKRRESMREAARGVLRDVGRDSPTSDEIERTIDALIQKKFTARRKSMEPPLSLHDLRPGCVLKVGGRTVVLGGSGAPDERAWIEQQRRAVNRSVGVQRKVIDPQDLMTAPLGKIGPEDLGIYEGDST